MNPAHLNTLYLTEQGAEDSKKSTRIANVLALGFALACAAPFVAITIYTALWWWAGLPLAALAAVSGYRMAKSYHKTAELTV